MPHLPKVTHVHIHTLRWDCSVHGGHIVLVAGLDSMALTMARQLVRSCESGDWPCTMHSLSIPIDDARSAAAAWEVDRDDLPF